MRVEVIRVLIIAASDQGLYQLRSTAAMVRRSSKKPRQIMADTIVPHFHNDSGVAMIEIGAREFMCVGAKPPFDHPHVFLDMGDDEEIICPYCSTLYRHDPALQPFAARPPECALTEPA
jgi:uncharacterized Zn-finger protein